jgi:hypothetical protein
MKNGSMFLIFSSNMKSYEERERQQKEDGWARVRLKNFRGKIEI